MEPVTEDTGLWSRRAVRLGAYVCAGLLSLGAGLGVTSAVRSSAASQIPSPPAKNQTFEEDFNGIGQDNQTNAVLVSAPGVVSVLAAGRPVASGVVITSSGYVLTANSGLRGTLTVRFAMSGKTYRATKVGSDDVANLALLKLADGKYPVVRLGNSDDIRLEDTVNDAGATGTATGVTLSTGEITGVNLPAVVGGHRLTGLIRVSSLDRPASEIGGPLLTLNAEVVGIAVAAGPRSAYGDGYVAPINAALGIAKQILG